VLFRGRFAGEKEVRKGKAVWVICGLK